MYIITLAINDYPTISEQPLLDAFDDDIFNEVNVTEADEFNGLNLDFELLSEENISDDAVLENGSVNVNCLFCNLPSKRIKMSREKLISANKTTIEQILCKSMLVERDEVYDKLTSNFNNEMIKYHKTCLAKFLSDVHRFEKKLSTSKNEAFHKNAHHFAFSFVCTFLEEDVIKLKKIVCLQEIVKLYEEKLLEKVPSLSFSVDYLKRKLAQFFKERAHFKKIGKLWFLIDNSICDYQESVLMDDFKRVNLNLCLR